VYLGNIKDTLGLVQVVSSIVQVVSSILQVISNIVLSSIKCTLGCVNVKYSFSSKVSTRVGGGWVPYKLSYALIPVGQFMANVRQRIKLKPEQAITGIVLH